MSWTQIDWATAAVVLMVAEIVAPGAFMLWLGFAAAGVFLLVLAMPNLEPIWQAVAFGVLAIASVSLYWKVFRKQRVVSDQPLLNRRAQHLVGQVYPLETAIVNGRGRVQVGDAFWTVEGADAPTGARVRVIDVRDMTLQVEAAK
ncbi:MAG: NfeD family protein [Proteobacteria bacterium]|nr:NfeD family protein [Pseudomonadota bacterium]